MPEPSVLTAEQLHRICHEACEGVKGARPDHPTLIRDVERAAFLALRSPSFRKAIHDASAQGLGVRFSRWVG